MTNRSGRKKTKSTPEKRPTGRATIEDVARSTGFSRATVSRVINNDGNVKPATATSVRSAIGKLGYIPNAAASALSGGKMRAVAVLLPDISSPYYSDLLEGADRVAQDKGYHVILKTRQSARSVASLVESAMADGYIIRHSRDPEHDRALLGRLRRNGVPFIFIGTPEEKDARAIMVDNVGGAREMAHHFVDHSFKRILFIAGAPNNLDSNDRAYGFKLGLSEKGYDLASLSSAQGDFSRDCAYRIAEERLAHANVDAVFAANDHMALGVLHYLNERGIRVPQDIALAGFDDTFFAEYLGPPLTTVRQPMHEIGAVAMENMVMAIEGATISASRIILPTRLVIRQSCGCPPALPGMHPEEKYLFEKGE